MTEIDFSGLLIVMAVAFSAPLVLALAPALRLPAVVLEIVAGIALGPGGFGWIEVDDPIRVLSLIGLAFQLFLAGLEIELDELRIPFGEGQPSPAEIAHQDDAHARIRSSRAAPRTRDSRFRLVALGFAVSFAVALLVGLSLDAAGQVDAPLLVAIILVATSLGIVVPVLKDANRLSSELGQLVIAAASVADFGAVILLSLFFSRESAGIGAQLVLLGGFALVCAAAIAALVGVERSMSLSRALLRLQDTTAQIRVRGAFVLLVAFVALAEGLGLEVILGAFLAGAVLALVDRDRAMTHPDFRPKLEAAGYGIFIPVFFVASGLQFDLDALFADAGTVARAPIFVAALLVVRGLPAVLYRRTVSPRETVAAALLQATSLPFIVAASMIGVELGVLDEATSAALIAAGLLSVLLFPLLALMVLRGVSAPTARRCSELEL
jgi:Kef-type K+ transport system membrane component KefB